MEWNCRIKIEIYLCAIIILRCIQAEENVTINSGNETDENITTTIKPKHYHSCLIRKLKPKEDSLTTKCSNCTCDSRRKTCQVNCFCDPDCSEEDKKTFTTKLNWVSTIETRKCFYSNPFYKINAENASLIRTKDVLYCVVLREEDISCYMEWAPMKHSNVFKTIQNYFIHSLTLTNFDLIWKIGQPVLALKSDDHYFLLGFPNGKSCSSTGPILYLIDTAITCEHFVNSKESCEENIFLNFSIYFNNKKIVENGTSNHTIDHFQCDKEYNNCNTGDFQPLIYNTTTEMCENVITRVKYTFFHNGIHGIVKSDVKLAVENVKGITKQHFEVEFKWANDSTEAIMKKSGNPGYLIGRPVIAAISTNNSIENISVLIFPFSEQTDKCPMSGVVNFGESLVFSCEVLIPYANLGAMCDLLRNETRYLNQLTFNTIGSYGDLNTTNLHNWIPINSYTKRNKLSTSSFPLCRNVSLVFRLTFEYALTGHRALPQSKIVAASFESVNTDYSFTCIGLKNCRTGIHRVSLRFLIAFINVTKH